MHFELQHILSDFIPEFKTADGTVKRAYLMSLVTVDGVPYVDDPSGQLTLLMDPGGSFTRAFVDADRLIDELPSVTDLELLDRAPQWEGEFPEGFTYQFGDDGTPVVYRGREYTPFYEGTSRWLEFESTKDATIAAADPEPLLRYILATGFGGARVTSE